MQVNGETISAVLKVALAWLLAAVSHAIQDITLSQIALVLTIAFTASQLYWGWRRYIREASEE